MPKKSADELVERMMTDEELVKALADPASKEATLDRLGEEYFINETELSKAILHKCPLTDEVLEDISGGLLSQLSFKRVLKKALTGATCGAFGGAGAGAAAGGIGALPGAGLGAVGGFFAGGFAEVFEEAWDSIMERKW